MIRSSWADNAARAFGMFGRGTIEKINDATKLQELDLNLLKDETKTSVERFGEYGFSSVPLGPSKDSKGVKKYAAAVVAFLSGNRSHGVILGVDDRRHRPQGLKEGEVALYDDQAQKVHVGRDGITISGGDDNLKQGEDGGSGQGRQSRSKKLPITVTTGDSTHVVAKDKITDTVKQTTRTLQDGVHEMKVGDDCYVKVEGDKVTVCKGDMKVIVSASRVDLGGEGGSAVATQAGFSTKVFAVL